MLAIATLFLITLNSFNQLTIEKKSLDSEWLDHKLKYKLHFLDDEEINRKTIFLKNYAFIMKANTRNYSFTLKMNEFGHLQKHERSKLFNLRKGLKLHQDEDPIYVGTQIPLEFDWRDRGVLSPVQNQLACGSCYAFAAVDAIESQFALHAGVLPDLSKQEIVDCSWRYQNYGCYGGFPQSVYQYCMENGISTTLAYPYRGRHYQCNRNNPNSSYKLAGYKELTEGDEDNLLRAIYNIGPISIAIDASSEEFDFYDSGIIDFPSCSSINLNHAVLAVGYSLHTRPYLIVKNSWGKNWGINGYFKIALFRNNMCGIAADASFPIPIIEK